MLIYNAFDWKVPNFAHVSLILAADKSKLSKRHGATSVGEFREQGCLSSAMVNFLSLLGWNDGSEQEIFSTQELQEKFSLDRINKSAAVFDKTKLVSRWGALFLPGLMHRALQWLEASKTACVTCEEVMHQTAGSVNVKELVS